jgi:murein DD-endopeptidase MepM/ murein hydrolase activator NlpD
MRANRGRSGCFRRHIAGVCLAFLVLAAFAPAAGAGLKERLQQAKHRLAQIKQEIQHQQQVLAELEARSAVIAQRYLDAKAAYDQVTAELDQTRQVLSRTRDTYRQLRGQLNSRIREAFMQGPGSPLEFLLGATSLAELSDRVEYVDALSQHDADLTTQVQNAKNELAARAADQARLQVKQQQKLQQVQLAQAEVNAQLGKAKQIYQTIQDRQNEAARLVKTLGKKYRAYLRSLYRTKYDPNGVFKVCPVGQPHIVTDSFGAPRYAGGFHLHMGDDIMAPTGTPILAPFDGTARSSYNGLGGQAVYVYGSAGFVYNAHLSSYSSNSNGSVQAGEVIGYVGTTGDAQGGPPHDHFEWHPSVLPSTSSWPQSPYGYSVISDAANPYPLLQPVC